MFELDELAENVGKGIILRVAGGDDDIFNSRWYGRRHILSGGSRDAVFWDVEVSYMHLWSGVQKF